MLDKRIPESDRFGPTGITCRILTWKNNGEHCVGCRPFVLCMSMGLTWIDVRFCTSG
jgi:hypothetical protein